MTKLRRMNHRIRPRFHFRRVIPCNMRLRGGGIVDLSSEIIVAVANSVFVLVVYMIILIHTRKRSKVIPSLSVPTIYPYSQPHSHIASQSSIHLLLYNSGIRALRRDPVSQSVWRGGIHEVMISLPSLPPSLPPSVAYVSRSLLSLFHFSSYFSSIIHLCATGGGGGGRGRGRAKERRKKEPRRSQSQW